MKLPINRGWLAASIVATGLTGPLQMARAQTQPAIQSLATDKYPSRMVIKDLNGSWRRGYIMVQDEDRMLGSYFRIMARSKQSTFESAGYGVAFTKGDVVTVGETRFLVAYRVQMRDGLRWQEVWSGSRRSQTDWDNRFAPDTPLILSLVNLNSAPDIESLRAFDPAEDLMRPQDIRAATMAGLSALGQLLSVYRYQPSEMGMSSVDAARTAFQNHFHQTGPLTDAGTGKPLQPNKRLDGFYASDVPNRDKIIAFYQGEKQSDGKRAVVFLSGRTERIPEWKFAAVLATKPEGISQTELNKNLPLYLKRLQAHFLLAASQNNGKVPDTYRYTFDARVRPEAKQIPGVPQSILRTYRFNDALFNVRLADITNRSKLILLYQSSPGRDGKFQVIYLDGRLAKIWPQNFWQRRTQIPTMRPSKPKVTNRGQRRRQS